MLLTIYWLSALARLANSLKFRALKTIKVIAWSLFVLKNKATHWLRFRDNSFLEFFNYFWEECGFCVALCLRSSLRCVDRWSVDREVSRELWKYGDRFRMMSVYRNCIVFLSCLSCNLSAVQLGCDACHLPRSLRAHSWYLSRAKHQHGQRMPSASKFASTELVPL